MEVLRRNGDFFSDQAINPLSYEFVLRRQKTPERLQHEGRPDTPIHLQRDVGKAPLNHVDLVPPAPENDDGDLTVNQNHPDPVDLPAPQVVERNGVINGTWRTGLPLTNFLEQAPEALEIPRVLQPKCTGCNSQLLLEKHFDVRSGLKLACSLLLGLETKNFKMNSQAQVHLVDRSPLQLQLAFLLKRLKQQKRLQ
jgi:hypothetical protein